MKKITAMHISLVAIVIGLGSYLVFDRFDQVSLRDDNFFDKEIDNFERLDKIQFPEPNSIVFVGSSTIRLWKSLADDMAPLKILSRGFGGAHMTHVLHNFERIITPYAPRAVVLFVGGNDLAAGLTAEELIMDYEKFLAKLNSQLPKTDLWILGMKPSKSRWNLWREMKEVDTGLQKFAAEHSKVNFVELGSSLLSSEGVPDDVYINDGLHLNSEGYRRWSQKLKPLLLQAYLN